MKTMALIVLAVFAGYVDEDKEYTLKVTVNGMTSPAGGRPVQKALQLKGVKKVKMDFDKKLFTLTVDARAKIKPGAILKAVPKRFTVPKILAEGLVGTVKKDRDKIVFTSKKSKLKYELEEAAKGKVLRELLKKLGDNKIFRVSGEAKEVEVRDKKTHRVKKVLKIVLSKAEKIKEGTVRFEIQKWDPC